MHWQRWCSNFTISFLHCCVWIICDVFVLFINNIGFPFLLVATGQQCKYLIVILLWNVSVTVLAVSLRMFHYAVDSWSILQIHYSRALNMIEQLIPIICIDLCKIVIADKVISFCIFYCIITVLYKVLLLLILILVFVHPSHKVFNLTNYYKITVLFF